MFSTHSFQTVVFHAVRPLVNIVRHSMGRGGRKGKQSKNGGNLHGRS
jgi:hypothetical protein